MKHNIILVILILLITACNNTSKKTDMYIEKASLSNQEKNIVNLLETNTNISIYDFELDETVKNIQVNTYELVDNIWSLSINHLI